MIDGFRRDSIDLVSDSGKSSMSSDTTIVSQSTGISIDHLSFEFPTRLESSVRRRKDLTFRDFSVVNQIGSGDIGRVYLCRLRAGEADQEVPLYAMKVVDREVVRLKKKTHRVETERRILRQLEHPFLPTLHAEFETPHFSCVVMEYCSGGDLHSLRHRQPERRFSISAARFYSAEVLVALEYLHMLGIIYRDLKPENVLVRSDGHIMLTDFDLSLCSDAFLTVETPDNSPDRLSPKFRGLSPFACMSGGNRRSQALAGTRLFVAEPLAARSCSFVGTHEYVAPEIAAGAAHGNAVDWWALGIFIYEMVYGRTPFAGANNEATLRNISKMPLAFPNAAPWDESEGHARDLISRLLKKDPNKRLGSRRGAPEVKSHPFFKGLNFALIRSVVPPSGVGILRRPQ